MVNADIKEIHETIKTMFGYALALSESPIPEMYELGHYLADNILTKVCLAVAIDKGEERQVYISRRRTKSLRDLYKDHLKPHYAGVPNYDPKVKKFHEDRNVYQHEIESFDRTMRQPRAKAYVDLVEEIMKIVGMIKSGETLVPANLNPRGINNLGTQQDITLEAKYKVKELIQILENYEDIKNDRNLEKNSIHSLAQLFPSLVYTNMDFKFTANDRPDTLKNDKYTISWSPIGVNPTDKFIIRKMKNKMKAVEPPEEYFSQNYVKNNPNLYDDKAKSVLYQFIIYLKNNI